MTSFSSIDGFISHWAKEAPSRAAIVSERSGETISYEELDRLIDHLCRTYEGKVAPQSICTIYLDDSIVCHAMLHAGFRLGAIVMPLDSALGELTQLNMLNHADSDLIFIGADNPNLGFVLGDVKRPVETFATELAAHCDALAGGEPFASRAGLDRTAMIAYTSGTTSNSKGVVLTHRNLIAAYRSATEHMCAPKVVGCVFRMASLGTLGIHFFYPQYSGGTTVMLPRLTVMNARELWTRHARHGIDFLYLVPSLLKMLNHLGVPPAQKPGGIAVCAGSHLPPAHQALFQDKFGIPTRNIYGLTESSFAVFFGRMLGDRGANDLGPACSLVARVVDEHGADVPDGTMGELWYSGEMVASGYYRNPEATAQSFRDGWLATGDLVVRDAEGNITITGRKKDVIIRGGFNIHPKDIEEAIQIEAGVVNSFVMGASNDVLSEMVLAFVQLDGAAAVDEAGVIERVKRRVGAFRAPDRYFFSDVEIPVNAAGKVDRRAILSLFDAAAPASG